MKYFSIIMGVLLVWVMVVCAQIAVAQESADEARSLIKRTYHIDDVTQVALKGGGVMDVVLGEEALLEVTASHAAQDDIKVGAQGDELIIDGSAKALRRAEHSRTQKNIRYRLVLKRLEGLSVAGTATVNIGEPITEEAFTLVLSGPVAVKMASLNSRRVTLQAHGPSDLVVAQLKADTLSVNISGPGEVTLAGGAQVANINMSGPAELHAKKLAIKKATMHLSGPSDASVWVEDTLTARANGPADIVYYGNPSTSIETNGPSSVKRRKGDIER